MYEATIDHRHRQDKETTPARPHTQSPSEQPRESATRTGYQLLIFSFFLLLWWWCLGQVRARKD